jgi:hypothetical protein
VPEGQDVQDVAAAPEYVLAGQDWQVPAFRYLPAGQLLVVVVVQLDAPASARVCQINEGARYNGDLRDVEPEAQVVHDDAPAPAKVPAGHLSGWLQPGEHL